MLKRFCTIVFLILTLSFSFLSFSCTRRASRVSSHKTCNVKIVYRYNDIEGDWHEHSFEYLFYQGEYLLANSTFTELSAGEWEFSQSLGYGYYTDEKQFTFLPDKSGGYIFLTDKGATWSTNTPLPSGSMVLYPKYVEEARDCNIKIIYGDTRSGVYTKKSFNFTVKYGTKLIDYLDGEPYRWSNGQWLPNALTNEYSYTDPDSFEHDVWALRYKYSTSSANKKVYLFKNKQTGEGYYTDSPITSPNLILEGEYRNTYNLDITVIFEVSNGMGGSKKQSLNMTIHKGKKLKDYGEPCDWVDSDTGLKPWTTSSDYSFVITEAGIKKKHFLKTDPSRGYIFIDQKTGTQIYTSDVINGSMTLVAQYDDKTITESKKLQIRYNTTVGNNVVPKTFDVEFDGEATEGFLNVPQILEVYNGDNQDNLGYGYVDPQNNYKAYYYDFELDAEGQKVYKFHDIAQTPYTQNIQIGNLPNNITTVIYPDYVNAGYRARSIDFTNSISINFVYIPGCTNNSWPYSSESYVRAAGEEDYMPMTPTEYVNKDTWTTNGHFPINSMYFSEISLDQKTIADIMSINESENYDYVFNPKCIDSTTGGLTYKSISGVAWNYVDYKDALVLCNLLTKIYNKQHHTNYQPVYRYVDPSSGNLFEYTDVNTPITAMVVSTTSKGFRIPTDSEWEYAARIITDERQLPEHHRFIIQQSAGEMRYFQSANDDYTIAYDSNTEPKTYLGSGAGLAFYDADASRYDPKKLRTGNYAMGHDNVVTNIANLVQKHRYAALDYNLKNGAGLYNMCGCVSNIVDSKLSGYGNTVVGTRGGAFSKKPTNIGQRLGYFAYTSILSGINTDEFAQCLGLRICFYEV